MQQSSVPAPITTPSKPQHKLVPVQAPPKRSKKGYIGLVCFLAVCAGAYWIYKRNLADEAIAAKRSLTAAVRTFSVAGGKISKTLRLTGSTGPEKYVTLLGPQLRGSRTFGGGQGAFMGRGDRGSGGGGSSRGGGGSSMASTGGGGGGGGGESSSRSSSSSSASGSVASSSGALGGTMASTNSASGGGMSGGGGGSVGGVRSSSGALRATTSRSSGGGGGRSSLSGGTSGAAAAASAVMGGDGLGSTSSSLPGSGGPGGGGSSSGGSGGPGGGSSSGDFGSVLQKLVKPGSKVQKGDVLAEFDRQFMLLRVDDYKAGVLQQELNIGKMKADLEVTHKAHDQQVNIAKGDITKAELDLQTLPVRSEIESERYKLALEEAKAKHKQLLEEVPFVEAGEKAQVRIAEMELQQSILELKRSEANADRMVMKSPIEGLVVMMQIFRSGDMSQVQQGDPVMPGMAFMQVVDASSMVVNATINQVDVERIRVGAKARIYVDAFPDLELPGHVFSVAAMPRSSGGSGRASYVKDIPVKIKLDAMDPRVIPDLSVSVDIIVQEEEAQAITPLASVFKEPSSASLYVYVKGPAGWEKRTVELGLSDNLQVAVKSGLKPGDVVAEELPPLPKDGEANSAILRRRLPSGPIYS